MPTLWHRRGESSMALRVRPWLACDSPEGLFGGVICAPPNEEHCMVDVDCTSGGGPRAGDAILVQHPLWQHKDGRAYATIGHGYACGLSTLHTEQLVQTAFSLTSHDGGVVGMC